MGEPEGEVSAVREGDRLLLFLRGGPIDVSGPADVKGEARGYVHVEDSEVTDSS